MPPLGTLQFTVSDAPRDLVSLEVPPSSDITEFFRFTIYHVSAPGFVEIFNSERLWLVNRPLDYNVAVSEPNVPSRPQHGKCDGTTQDCLCLQRLVESQDEGRRRVDSGYRSSQHRRRDVPRLLSLIFGVLIHGHNCLCDEWHQR